FHKAKLEVSKASQGRGAVLHAFYRELLRLRREVPSLATRDLAAQEVFADDRAGALFVRRWAPGSEVVMVFQIGQAGSRAGWTVPGGPWPRLIASAGREWEGPGTDGPAHLEPHGSPVEVALTGRSFVVYEKRG